MKKKVLVPLVLLGLVAAVLFWWILPGTPLEKKDGTNTNAADKDIQLFYDELDQHYPQVYQRLPEQGHLTYTIPGLIQTATLIAKGDEKGEVETAEDMTPQGLTFVEDYVVISAYSKSLQYNSVLWLLDKQSGEFVKTIVLPTTSHVGGMAYDPIRQRLWVTTTDEQTASQISALDLVTLNQDDFSQTEEAITFDFKMDLGEIEKSSYMTYHENALFVGYFDKEEQGHVGYYQLDENGFPMKNEGQGNERRPSAVFDTAEQVQGMTFLGDYVVFSQSYGNKDSKLLYFANSGIEKWTDFEEGEQVEESLVTPPYMQQIVAEGDALYLLFESSATKYRLNPTVTTIDRVIKINGLPEKN